jgi:hypothetical protein
VYYNNNKIKSCIVLSKADQLLGYPHFRHGVTSISNYLHINKKTFISVKIILKILVDAAVLNTGIGGQSSGIQKNVIKKTVIHITQTHTVCNLSIVLL